MKYKQGTTAATITAYQESSWFTRPVTKPASTWTDTCGTLTQLGSRGAFHDQKSVPVHRFFIASTAVPGTSPSMPDAPVGMSSSSGEHSGSAANVTEYDENLQTRETVTWGRRGGDNAEEDGGKEGKRKLHGQHREEWAMLGGLASIGAGCRFRTDSRAFLCWDGDWSWPFR